MRASSRVAAVTFSHFTKWLARSSFEAIAFGTLMAGCCVTVVKTDSAEMSVMPYKAAANSRDKTYSLPGTPLRNEVH